MRKRFKAMQEAANEPTGDWMRDRHGREWSGEDLPQMSEAQRTAGIAGLVRDIRDLFDRRKHPERAILRDTEAVDTALIEALGFPRMRGIADYLCGGEFLAPERQPYIAPDEVAPDF
jgi:hypothetical protein